MEKQARQCADLIKSARSIVALTGAGISTNAGIPDFRGPKGLYVTKQYDPDAVFDINAFFYNPQPFFEFAQDFINLENKLKPTFTHEFLAKLETCAKIKGVITQNIDSLHQLGGSSNVLEIHGSFWQSFCVNCAKGYSYQETKRLILEVTIPKCSCGAVIKPDIVFFGENVKYLPQAEKLACEADLFFIIGTSCVVYPAAALPERVSGKIVVVNKGKISTSLPNVAIEVDHDIDQFFRKVAEYV